MLVSGRDSQGGGAVCPATTASVGRIAEQLEETLRTVLSAAHESSSSSSAALLRAELAAARGELERLLLLLRCCGAAT